MRVAVLTNRAGDLLHGFYAGSHGLTAPAVEEMRELAAQARMVSGFATQVTCARALCPNRLPISASVDRFYGEPEAPT